MRLHFHQKKGVAGWLGRMENLELLPGVDGIRIPFLAARLIAWADRLAFHWLCGFGGGEEKRTPFPGLVSFDSTPFYISFVCGKPDWLLAV